jgi:basic amino acid/polyamine antiporter, APA family
MSQASTRAVSPAPRTSLVRILGLGFGLAVIFGGTVGVGILRLPATVADQLRSFWPIMLVWIAGGCYALLGANSVAELGAAMPQAGGFYVYSRRAFGTGVGFAVGWADWLSNCAVIAYASVTAAEYVVALVPAFASRQTLIALGLLVMFCSLQAAGLRLSSSIQKLTSSITAITFLLLAAACLLHGAQETAPLPSQGFRNTGILAMLVPVVAALRAIVVA